MADRASRSLLDFAIVASLAVVPVLLAVLLVIGAATPPRHGERHVSVRQVAALKTFERAIVGRDAVRVARPDAAALVALVPECAAEWRNERRVLDRVKTLFDDRNDDARTPARRIASHLANLDDALRRFSSDANRRVVHGVAFDAARWAQAARQALATPVHAPQYPDLQFRVRCADLQAAAAMLARANGRMLDSLVWRGTAVERAIADWPPDQYVAIPARQLARANPWGGVPGCTYLWRRSEDGSPGAPAYFVKSARAVNERVCAQPPVFAGADPAQADAVPMPLAGEPAADTREDDARWQVPPSLHALLQPLESLQKPSGSRYLAYVDASASGPSSFNRVTLDGAVVDVGFTVDLTIDPELQALAQKTAACYTGRQDVCRALGLRRAEDGGQPLGHRLLERAVVRMAAIAIVDVASGRIEALAGALSPCTRQEFDGPGRAAECDSRLPYPIRYRPDALLNPAVFHDAMPASTVKPIMAAAFLSNATVGAKWLAGERTAMRSAAPPTLESLRGQLMRSESARFLDRMFCGDRKFATCERAWEIQAASSAFGWNAGCETASEQCGRRDLLFGRSAAVAGDATPIAAWVPYGRLLVEPVGAKSGAFRTRARIPLDTNRIRRCAEGADGRRASRDDWEKCSGGVVVDIVAEGWGQGHARSTALGGAGMMAALAAAANGQAESRKPHLVDAVRGVSGTRSALGADAAAWAKASIEPNRLSRDAAEVILNGLSYSHRNGTSRRACEQVFDARTCREVDWIAGKTGTPTFPNDERSLDELAKLCAPAGKRSAAERDACGALRPYKWYVAAYRADRRKPQWTKAIGVLTERNWLADTGRVHGAGDHGPNPAAEIAFQIAGRHARAFAAGDVR